MVSPHKGLRMPGGRCPGSGLVPSEGPVSDGVHRREQRDGAVMDGLGRGPSGRVWCGGRDPQGGLWWHQSRLHSLFLRSQPWAKGRIYNHSHLFRCFDTGWHFLAGHSVKFRGPVDPSWGSGKTRGGQAGWWSRVLTISQASWQARSGQTPAALRSGNLSSPRAPGGREQLSDPVAHHTLRSWPHQK